MVEVEPSSKAKSVKWSEGRLMLLYAGLMHATRALRVRTLARRVIVLARLAIVASADAALCGGLMRGTTHR